MDNKVLLAKSISLLYKESLLSDKTENSSDLVRTVLNDVQIADVNIGISTERDALLSVKRTILEMCDNPPDHEYDRDDLLQRVRINVGNDEKYYEAIKQGIEVEVNEANLKRSVLIIRKALHNHFREKQIKDVIAKAHSAFNYNRETIKDVNEFLTDHITKLESLSMVSSVKDPAVIGDIDIGDEGSTNTVFNQVKNMNNAEGVYQFGWPELNQATQGGGRPGETIVIGALQHKYKTGFTLSVFAQIAMYNKPKTKDPNKKPLLLRISFEDDLVNNLQFVYQYLKFSETNEPVDLVNVTVDEMSAYVKEKLQVNGFHIKMMRVDPNQWTYRSICNKVIELEAQGYNVEVLMVDYLSKVPTIGCVSTGPSGTDVMDQLGRMRQFCAS